MATVERSKRISTKTRSFKTIMHQLCRRYIISMWINPSVDNANQSKICPNCGQENDRYGLPIYPFNKSTKALDWCAKCLGKVEDITTVNGKLPQANNV